jgi:LPS-assembly protein
MGQRLLTADEAEINAEKRSVRLQGKVEYLDPTLRVRGQGGSFQDAGIGEFKGAEFELLDRSVRAAAEDARLRAGGRVIELAGVKYTACPPGSDDWQLAAGEISIDQESRIGTGRDVRLDFLGVPIFYTPWISFPVGEQRKSGLLFPTIGSGSRTGTQVAVPYYWNLAPNYDATLTTRWYSSRGVRLDPELRHLNERSRSQLNVEYLFDDRDTGDARGVVELRHVTRVAPRTRLLIDATNVSDNDYYEDFGVGFEGTSVSFVDRYIDLRHDTASWSFNARAQGFQVIDDDARRRRRAVPDPAAADGPGHAGRDWQAACRDRSLRKQPISQRDAGTQGVRLDTQPALEWRVDGHGAFFAAGAAYRYTQYLLDDVAPGADDSPDRSLPIGQPRHGLHARAHVGLEGQSHPDTRAATAVPLRAVPRPGRPAGVRHRHPRTSTWCNCSVRTATSGRTGSATPTR